jgi:hypothetical protein
MKIPAFVKNSRQRFGNRRSNRRKALFFLTGLAIVFLGALLLGGCNGSERFGDLTVTTGLPAGSTIQIQTKSTEDVFHPVQTATVDSSHAVRFIRLLPGEYRLTQLDANGAVIYAGDPFGVAVGESTLAFNPPPANPS